MAEESEAIVRELSTLSTAPTVRTSVEANGQRTILEPRNQEPREEEQGGSGGKEGKPSAAGAVNASWEHALRARNSCLLGHCKYADPKKRPNGHMGAQGCDGYHASEHIDADGRVTVRWYLCIRHREWWRLERIRLHAARLPKPPHPGIGPER